MYCFYHPFTLRWCLSLKLRCVSCRQRLEVFSFLICLSVCVFCLEIWGYWYLKLLLLKCYVLIEAILLMFGVFCMWMYVCVLSSTLCFNVYGLLFLSSFSAIFISFFSPKCHFLCFIYIWFVGSNILRLFMCGIFFFLFSLCWIIFFCVY